MTLRSRAWLGYSRHAAYSAQNMPVIAASQRLLAIVHILPLLRDASEMPGVLTGVADGLYAPADHAAKTLEASHGSVLFPAARR